MKKKTKTIKNYKFFFHIKRYLTIKHKALCSSHESPSPQFFGRQAHIVPSFFLMIFVALMTVIAANVQTNNKISFILSSTDRNNHQIQNEAQKISEFIKPPTTSFYIDGNAM